MIIVQSILRLPQNYLTEEEDSSNQNMCKIHIVMLTCT